jgi:hypothetical protein
MAQKLDGVVEAVRYAPDGQVAMVRIYERRGPTWSDRQLMDRDTLIQKLRAKKRYFIGQRVEFMAGTFQVTDAVRLLSQGGKDILATAASADHDSLKGAPLF